MRVRPQIAAANSILLGRWGPTNAAQFVSPSLSVHWFGRRYPWITDPALGSEKVKTALLLTGNADCVCGFEQEDEYGKLNSDCKYFVDINKVSRSLPRSGEKEGH